MGYAALAATEFADATKLASARGWDASFSWNFSGQNVPSTSRDASLVFFIRAPDPRCPMMGNGSHV
jgi:hypothetical protein